MKTREDIITSMCYTYNHAYGLLVDNDSGPIDRAQGFTKQQQQQLWNSMAQLYDNDIAPHHTLKSQ
jgi:hypothetical protein